MKRIIIFVLLTGMLLFSCQDQSNQQVDVASAAENIVSALAWDDELALVDDQVASSVYSIPDGLEDVALYLSSGATAEEVAVFSFSSEDKAKEMEQNLKSRIDSQIAGFSDYVPDEVPRLESAVIYRSGRYVAFCVSGDENAQKEVEAQF